jgi:hypothetical protein
MCSQFVNATLTGRVTEPAGHGHRRTVFTLAAVHSYVPANTATTLSLRLPAKALAALAARTPEPATFKLTAVDEHGTAEASTKLSTLRPVG